MIGSTSNTFVTQDSDIVRHFAAYIFLAVFVYFAFYNTKSLQQNANRYTLIFIFLFGVFDETHQLFLPNRFAEVKDVVVDFASSLFFIGIKKLIV